MRDIWTRWQQSYLLLQKREQLAVQLMALLLISVVLLEALFLPMLHWHQRLDKELEQNRQAAALLRDHRDELLKVAAQEQALSSPLQPLLAQAAQAVGMPAPASATSHAGVWLISYKGVPFDTLLALIRRLQGMGLGISHFDISRIKESPGMVDAELSIDHPQ